MAALTAQGWNTRSAGDMQQRVDGKNWQIDLPIKLSHLLFFGSSNYMVV
jgi:hypothetical protein